MQSICDAIDSSLKYKRTLKPSSVLVYQVERADQFYVLKIQQDFWDRNHLRNEKNILSHCGDIKGITHLIQWYKSPIGFLQALLKEYASGETLRERAFGKNYSDNRFQSSLEKTIRELHYRRIAGLDLRSSNVVISADQTESWIVDLGTAKVHSKKWERSFRKRVEKDLTDMDSML